MSEPSWYSRILALSHVDSISSVLVNPHLFLKSANLGTVTLNCLPLYLF